MGRGCLLLAAACLLLLPGCGSNLARVSGEVTLDGKPLETGTIVFQGEGQAMGVGEIEGGSYAIKTGNERGLAPGKYRVTVSAFQTRPGASDMDEPVPAFLTPQRYNDPETSGLEVEVQPGSNTFDFPLEG